MWVKLEETAFHIIRILAYLVHYINRSQFHLRMWPFCLTFKVSVNTVWYWIISPLFKLSVGVGSYMAYQSINQSMNQTINQSINERAHLLYHGQTQSVIGIYSKWKCFLFAHALCSIKARFSSDSQCRDSHYDDMMVVGSSYIYHKNSWYDGAYFYFYCDVIRWRVFTCK